MALRPNVTLSGPSTLQANEPPPNVLRLLEARNAELRALVAKWRDHWSVQPQGADKESAAMGGGIEHCADELEQWLDGKNVRAEPPP